VSRYLPDPSVPLDTEVLEAVRASSAPFYAVMYPSSRGGCHVSLLQGEDADIYESFDAADLDAADRELLRRGYASLASVLGQGWDPLPGTGRGTPVFRDH
jgi:hypothetical protein